MKIVVVLSFCIAASLGAAVPKDTKSEIASLRELPALEQEDVRDESGQFSLRYVTAEGTVVWQRGRFMPSVDGKGPVFIIEGEVSYVGDDGKTYDTKYTAGVDGYIAKGDHLPTVPETKPHPVPEHTQ